MIIITAKDYNALFNSFSIAATPYQTMLQSNTASFPASLSSSMPALALPSTSVAGQVITSSQSSITSSSVSSLQQNSFSTGPPTTNSPTAKGN